ncbi:non-ribosomal peptide synthetase [Pedosphaera parvula]|uniref:Amino acid adenylation domain protein n=1 Tax=Pedosphaera parvula (strain Ellin514) TaxID=320771 RepID=B9XPV8_PEDPL|nr:non-ribosomal peptide synthetase [Pedosphaera parvula]EEF58139.1 amino acid adenylation domain protein [Pedosphaera parvula Ellin514]
MENKVAADKCELSREQEDLFALLLEEERRSGICDRIGRRDCGEQAPLSSAQERIWFIGQIEAGSSLYNISAAFRMTGDLNIEALEWSLNEIIRRHENLRTTFVSIEGQPKALVAAATPLTLSFVDQEVAAQTSLQQILDQSCRAEASSPFDLTKGPLLRIKLLRLNPDDHVLLLTMHHIISDGWSLELFYKEVAALYSSRIEGGESPLPELPIQYGDYAVWQRQSLRGKELEEDLAYWKGKLKGPLPTLEMPADRPRQNMDSRAGSVRRTRWPEELTQQVRKLARAEGITLFILLLAAFKVLLHRYTGLEDIIVGTPVANRNRSETEGLIGLFVNTLVLRTEISGSQTFKDFLIQVRNTMYEALEHKEASFEKLVEELNPERNLASNPIFQVMFLIETNPARELKLPGLKIEPLPIDEGTAKCDIILFIADREDRLAPAVEYNTSLFDAATMDALLEHFQVLVEGIISDPNQRICDLPILTAAERKKLLVEWNSTGTEYPKDKTISQLFAEQAAARPDAIAIVFENKKLSYRELNEQSNQLAHYLIKTGVQRDDLVGICLERSCELIVSLVAILKAGAGYVSLDPTYPKERLSWMLEDAESRIILTDSSLAKALPIAVNGLEQNGCIPKIICLDEEWKAITGQSLDCPTQDCDSESIAYVCFTSGSTGRPKGVCIPHRGVVRLVKCTNYASMTEADTFLQFAPVSFDASTFEIWGALLNGARLVVFPPKFTSLAELEEFIQKQQITILFLTAGLFHQMVEEQVECLKGLRVLLSGGEVLSTRHVQKALDALSGCQVIDVYGPTENTTFTSWHGIPRQLPAARSIPIGRPISNTTCFILDDHLQPVPIGVYGYLYTGGDGLALGYLKNPDLTAARFVRNPFDVESQSKLYNTGDVVRYLQDGNIEFLGRKDSMVKIRGFRVELGEVEVALLAHHAIRECVAMVHNNSSLEKQLVAYVVPREKGKPTSEELRMFLKDKLPDYMLPSVYVNMESLPLTATGKVNRRALPQLDGSRPELGKDYLAPRDPVEVQLVRIWEELLGIRPVGVQDKFFELGGHSLLAVRLFAKIEKTFGKRLALRLLFETPTIEQLANAIREKELSTSRSLLVPIRDSGSRPPLFLVHGAGGGILWGYANLGGCFSDDQPVYGIESPGMRGMPEVRSIEEMASRYVSEIRGLQSEGPYFLGGYCFGGNVAFEMARQLREKGERVALLALFESMPFHSSYDKMPWWRPGFYKKFFINVFYVAKDFLKLQPAVRRDLISRRSRVIGRKLANIFKVNKPEERQFDLEAVVDTAQIPDSELALWRVHLQAIEEHAMKPYSGRVTLFRTCRQPLFCSFEDSYGWNEFCFGGVDVKIIPGSHESIFTEPNVRRLASEVEECLREAHESFAPTTLALTD